MIGDVSNPLDRLTLTDPLTLPKAFAIMHLDSAAAEP
jgi:hypothetical protein